ncbi:TetR family transcriptional regulator [Gluconacetobacter tumulicola]|uniref:TetR family transcriptional regulator n=1 Tax=Gluconacetobacter tumulicola TaxID=1017177 RepID=A0A7W4JFQ9_9PROT|nr:TetR family transcriptional regulator [Gluconacetobacter tumulicola]MBB2180351.1 TetR family transcriptional regulator [Gluconacetobacter tumulicola]
MTLRAYDKTAKEERRSTIIQTARHLFEKQDGRLPSVAQIAEAASLGKGTIYIYYRTKEEIFAALLRESWAPALRIVEEEMTARSRPKAQSIQSFVTRFVEYVEANPRLLRLDALSKEVLERNMSPEALIAHKRAFLESLDRVSRDLEAAFGLERGRGFQLLTRCHALTRGLWQSFGDPVQGCATAEFPHPNFGTELKEALQEYWRGALSKEWLMSDEMPTG